MNSIRGRDRSSSETLLETIFQRSFESLWAAAFWVAGRLGRPSPRLWSSPGGQHVLVVAPHPDDEAAGCGGVILRHRRRGDRVRIVCVTDGGRSGALGLAPEAMGAVRRGEMEAAAEILGAELEWIGLAEGQWSADVLVKRIVDSLTRFRPHVVYATSRVDFHPEHVGVAKALGRAIDSVLQTGKTVIRVYPVQTPLTASLCNLVSPVDVSDPRFREAFEAHRSQLGSLRRCWRLRRYAGSFYGLGGGAEEFWQLSPPAYARLHRESSRGSKNPKLRGLRLWALSDPLSYLKGFWNRRHLAREASAGGAVT